VGGPATTAAADAAGAGAIARARMPEAPERPELRGARHRIVIAREQYKFSCAHMTVFPDGSKERLHGHNYTIAVALEVARVDLAAMIPFAPIKGALGELCAAWKEYVLIAANNPHLVIARDDGRELDFTLCGDHYVLPRGDVLLLPIDNISVEALASHVADLLRERLAPLAGPHVRALEVTIEESPGQGATCVVALGPLRVD
jgi:6-pyruvoyltetrahydropterin/6-carboxytetrahydropterin synthase